MPRFAANLTLQFAEVPFLERFGLAASLGFEGVEYMFPYEASAEDVAALLAINGLRQVQFNLPAGDWAAGDRGIAALPERVEEFRAGVAQALGYARALDCKRLTCLAGITWPGADQKRAEDTFVANLSYAADQLQGEGITLLIEPINTRDIPGMFLSHTAQAIRLIEAIGAPNVRLQYDVYHMQIMEGDLARTIERHLPLIGHIQIADVPGRHEPGTGEIRYAYLFDLLDRLGYDGWVGCEYRPAAKVAEGLGWIPRPIDVSHQTLLPEQMP